MGSTPTPALGCDCRPRNACYSQHVAFFAPPRISTRRRLHLHASSPSATGLAPTSTIARGHARRSGKNPRSRAAVSNARVAAVTSDRRIRLSPTRKALRPRRGKAAGRSAWVRTPCFWPPGSGRGAPSGAADSVVARSVVNDLRLRLFMPNNDVSSPSARSISRAPRPICVRDRTGTWNLRRH